MHVRYPSSNDLSLEPAPSNTQIANANCKNCLPATMQLIGGVYDRMNTYRRLL